MFKAQKRKLYKARLSYKKGWEQKYPWLYCDDPIRACPASSARSEEIHLLQPGVHGLLGEFRIGITLLNNSRNIASQNVTEMLLSMLEWQKNGDELLQQHVKEGPQNVQYTSKFSAVMLLEAINSWLDRKLIESLKLSPYFPVLADECVDRY